MNFYKSVVIAGIALLFCGCTAAPPKPDVNMIVKAQYEPAIKRVAAVLVKEGYGLPKISSGVLATEFMDAKGFVAPARQRARVFVREIKPGTLSIDVTVIVEGYFDDSWTRAEINTRMHKEEKKRTAFLAVRIKADFMKRF